MGFLDIVERNIHYLSRYPNIGKFFATIFGALEVPLLEFIYLVDNVHPGFFDRSMAFFWKYYGSRIIPLDINLKTVQAVSPTDEIVNIIRRVPSLAIGYCYCRNKHKNCSSPVWTCIHVGTGKQLDELGKKMPLKTATADEVEQLLYETDRLGLVHQLITAPSPDYFYVICNCCPCCCVMLSAAINVGTKDVVLASNFVANQVDANCKSCGKCINRCYFKARTLIKERLNFDPARCTGCGLCVSICDFDAIQLVRRPNDVKYKPLYPLREYRTYDQNSSN
ncbi:MAG: ATP-binding protein [Candidatus Odinarchaeota archaeon]